MAGYKNAEIMINEADDLLASTTGIEKISATILAGTDDTNNPEGTDILRRGLVLTKVTASGKYSNHDSAAVDGLADESEAVVLAERVEMVAGEDAISDVYFRGTFDPDALIVDDSGNFDWSAVQRLRRHDK